MTKEIIRGHGIFKTSQTKQGLMGNILEGVNYLVQEGMITQDEGTLVLAYSKKDGAYIHVGKINELTSLSQPFVAEVKEKDLMGEVTQMIQLKFKQIGFGMAGMQFAG